VNEHGVKARRGFQRAKVLQMNKDVRGEKNYIDDSFCNTSLSHRWL